LGIEIIDSRKILSKINIPTLQQPSNQEYKSIKTETTKRNTDTVAIHPGNGTNKTIITPVASIGL